MARAKRTERADARRRYRQAVLADPESVELDDDVDSAAASGTPVTGRRPATAPTGPKPMGFTDAMRAAWHRPDIRADIASLPWLVRTRAFVVPLAIVLASSIFVFATPVNSVSILLIQIVILPTAFAVPAIVGFFAKRASYLLAFILAIVSVISFSLIVYAYPALISDKPLDNGTRLGYLVVGFQGIPLSVVFASGAAWYRRFLQLSSRQRAATGKPGQGRSGQQRPKASRPARG